MRLLNTASATFHGDPMHTTNGEVSGCPTPRPGGSWLLLLILAAVQFNHIVDFTIMMPLETSYQHVLNISTHQFSLLVSSYAFSACLSGLLAASLVDRFDRKRALLFLFAGFTGGTALCAAANSFGVLLLGRAVAGAFGGIPGVQRRLEEIGPRPDVPVRRARDAGDPVGVRAAGRPFRQAAGLPRARAAGDGAGPADHQPVARTACRGPAVHHALHGACQR